MKLLLDTHAFIWWRAESKRLKAPARRAIAAADEVFVSAASAWEVAIKTALGKLRLPGPFEPAVVESGFRELPVSFRHTSLLLTLPLHHADPFDRLLAAQAAAEALTLVTHDRVFRPYALPTIWT